VLPCLLWKLSSHPKDSRIVNLKFSKRTEEKTATEDPGLDSRPRQKISARLRKCSWGFPIPLSNRDMELVPRV
jgi:hypothetical protein